MHDLEVGRYLRTPSSWLPWLAALATSLLCYSASRAAAPIVAPAHLEVVLAADVRAELNHRFDLDNLAWQVNASEESLGCLTGFWQGPRLYITGWALAINMRRLHHAVAGLCSTEAIGSWHSHPWDSDPRTGGPLKYRAPSLEDRVTFERSDPDLDLLLLSYDVDSFAALVRVGGAVVPAVVR